MFGKIMQFIKRNFSATEGLSCEDDCEAISNLTKLRKSHQKEIEELKSNLKAKSNQYLALQNLTINTIDHLDDMLWAKTLDGKYILANKAFREKFCYGLSWDEIEGKTDIELASVFKSMVGDDNHTFGELCVDSDKIIHETEEARQFLEHGLINGKVMRLIVSKSPMYDCDGIFYATCGTGRDITEFYNKLEKAVKESESCFGKLGRDFLKELYKDIEFRNGNNG